MSYSGGGYSGSTSQFGSHHQPSFQNQMLAPPPSMGSLPSSYRPTFNHDGKGVPFNSYLNMIPESANNDVSYDTNSKDPIMLRSRIFVGNLLPSNCTREEVIELCRPFGNVIAATLFKGFSFVQFSNCDEADAAVAGLDKKRWKGSCMDVRLATLNHRPGYSSMSASNKKRKVDDVYLDETMAANDRNRRLAMGDTSTNDDLADTSMADTLICGGCRFVTCDFEVWKAHRVAGCAKPKDLREPEIMRCASCEQRFESAWGLIVHLTEFHRMMLYRPETKEAAVAAAAAATVASGSVTPQATPSKGPTFSEDIEEQPDTEENEDESHGNGI